jgi:hypothetical protein
VNTGMRALRHQLGKHASKTTTALAAVSLAACSARTIQLPEAQGTLALTETVNVYGAVTQRCADVNGWTAEMTIAGAIDGRHVRTRLLAAFGPPIVRLNRSLGSGDPSFVFLSQAIELSCVWQGARCPRPPSSATSCRR